MSLAFPLTRSLARPLTRLLTGERRGGGVPVITGFAYPGNTLTSTRAGQWTQDGVAIDGETGTTYVVKVADVGTEIACGDSAPVTVTGDADAKNYAVERSLTEPNALDLHGFLADIKAGGIVPVQVILGQSRFLARSGTTHHSVIGGDATVNGTVSNNADGLGFVGNASNFLSFPNPKKGTSVDLGVYATFTPATLANHTLVSAGPFNSGLATNGPVLAANAAESVGVRTRGVLSENGTNLRQMVNSQVCAVVGMTEMFGVHAIPNFAVSGATSADEPGGGQSWVYPGIWNDGTTWRIGCETDGGAPANGKIEAVIVTDARLTSAQTFLLRAVLAKYGIASMPQRIAGLVGDSMTVSASGPNFTISRTPQLFAIQNSGWRGTGWKVEAVGGQGIDQQETYFATVMAAMAQTDLERYIFFWGGYNPRPGFNYDSTANAEALANRYLAMAATAKAAGIQTVHWSSTYPVEVVPGSATAVIYNHFNDYYKAQCAIHGYVFYDHRVNYPTEFDGSTRNPLFFADSVHMSQLGVTTIVADFLATYNTPTNPFI